MPTCVPIKEMRNTAAFAELVANSDEPVIVTKNGYDQFVVIRSGDYDDLKRAEAKAKLMERIAIAEHERATGVTCDFDEALNQITEKHGL